MLCFHELYLYICQSKCCHACLVHLAGVKDKDTTPVGTLVPTKEDLRKVHTTVGAFVFGVRVCVCALAWHGRKLLLNK